MLIMKMKFENGIPTKLCKLESEACFVDSLYQNTLSFPEKNQMTHRILSIWTSTIMNVVISSKPIDRSNTMSLSILVVA